LGGTGWPRGQSTKPTRVGRKLIKTACEYDLEGEARLEYAPEGLICELTPRQLNKVQARRECHFSPALQGVRILIVEDEYILAMDPENRLKGADCEVIGRVSREAKALELLERDRPDAVVLDLNLNGKLPTDLVDALVAR
jgi:hypothetical protein